jgi:nicotinate-nucleotide pyrophosphorylase (carboxylating)
MQSPIDISALLRTALGEDIGAGDVTSLATIPADVKARFAMNTRAELVVCGVAFLPELFAMVNAGVKVDIRVGEGEKVPAGATLAIIEGQARALLSGERVALNLVQQLSGVATLTRRYVEAVAGTGAVILDTRKTVLGMRVAQKYAVKCGGGQNHRMGLYDAVLIKDNHIAVAGGVAAAVKAARAHMPQGMTLEVECDTLAQLDEALAAGVDVVLLDNMSNAQLSEAVAKVRELNTAFSQAVKTEASGNVSLETVRGIAQTGVDYISVGKLTHSAVAVDIGLDEV